MTDEQEMAIEMQRVRDLLAQGVSAVETEGGNIRYFNAAFLTAAMQLHSEVEGSESIVRTVTRLGVREITRATGGVN
jgi:hypothetical protein